MRGFKVLLFKCILRICQKYCHFKLDLLKKTREQNFDSPTSRIYSVKILTSGSYTHIFLKKLFLRRLRSHLLNPNSLEAKNQLFCD